MINGGLMMKGQRGFWDVEQRLQELSHQGLSERLFGGAQVAS